MMKHCNYCGKELHENASFCPYCMKSLIEKKGIVIHEKKSGKWLYLLVIGLLLALLIVLVCFLMRENKEIPENHSDIAIEITEATTITTTTTEPISTTVTTTTQAETTTSTTETTAVTTQTESTAKPEMHATTTETIITTVPPETTMSQVNQFQLGDYITEGKTLSQIQGYGGYEDMGGIVLTIEEITDTTLTFSIVQYNESGLASDTVSARNITAQLIDNTAEFEFRDMLDGRGTGRLTLENGMIHIETWGDTNRPTSIIVNEYLN